MLEVVAAAAMLTTVMAAVMVLIRTSYSAWEAHEQDIERTETLYGALRHFTRQARQANSVTAISNATDIEGSITFVMVDGDSHTWSRAANDIVSYSVSGSTTVNEDLAINITELVFTGYLADGVTQSTDPASIQVVECMAKTTLLHGAGETRTATCRAWLRAW